MAAEIRGHEIRVRRADAPSLARLFVVGGVLVAAATAVELLLAMVLRNTLGVPAGFSPLTPPAVATMTIAGMIGATVVFGWLARARPDPRGAFVRIAVAALVVSWLPDLGIWATGVFPHTTGAGGSDPDGAAPSRGRLRDRRPLPIRPGGAIDHSATQSTRGLVGLWKSFPEPGA